MSQQVTLEPHVRGDPFEYHFTLGNDWVFADFTGGLKFTLRTSVPASTVVADTDATGQSTSTGGGITGSGANGTVAFTSAVTSAWPKGLLYWDLEGTVSGTPTRKYTIDRGTIQIIGDITRG
jgi:hypothetical protein